ncbi:Ankyrin repeats (3 copies) [Popillia japonica]|uniref:Protein phosphatase 1 regulatory subunit 12B n=2 Tax=Popillia japonica TaxID=7064 RepID=A0AAW1LD00_POPJA
MSAETRSSSALFKRAEQLKRWEESETNREPVNPKHNSRKIKFSSGCVFLAACAAGEKDEVLRLLEKEADIDTANVDGLTALHQACIDDNLDMVEFLVENGADVNRGDNEGWTPLHATASCGFLSIAKYLIEHGANVAAVNCDGELALDITESDAMEDLLRAEVKVKGIDCDKARSEEERLMLRDANEWLATSCHLANKANPKTGATPLHVAAAKGYTNVMKVLLQCSPDINLQDNDGWTPLHAAAHWGQKEATELLANNGASMDAQNFVGQTPFDVSDNDMVHHLDILKKRQVKDELIRPPKKRQDIPENRRTDTETPPKLKKVEMQKVEVKIEGENEENNKEAETVGMDVSSSSSSESETESSETESESDDSKSEKKNRENALNNEVHITTNPEPIKGPPTISPKQTPDNVIVDDSALSWRRSNQRPNSQSFRDKETNENEVSLRRFNSFQNDPEFYDRYLKLRARIQANSFPSYYHRKSPSEEKSPFIIPPLSNFKQRQLSVQTKPEKVESTNVTNTTTTTTTTSSSNTTTNTTNNTSTVTSSPTKVNSPATSPQQQVTVRRSFVPPVRDEESETQRKAHAKRVRETRRSTQGVTLEEIKSAEQLVKKKNQATVNNNNNNTETGANGDTSNTTVSVTATITTATPTVITRDTEDPVTTSHERRPSWRLRLDTGSKFKLEDVNKPEEPPSTPSFVRRTGLQSNSTTRPSSAPVETADTTVTLSIRRPKSLEEKEQDKENDARNAQATLATQAAIQRRRRPKRRSTGVVAFDNMEDGEPEKDNSGGGDFEDSSKMNHQEVSHSYLIFLTTT